jgi:hypothetical protein
MSFSPSTCRSPNRERWAKRSPAHTKPGLQIPDLREHDLTIIRLAAEVVAGLRASEALLLGAGVSLRARRSLNCRKSAAIAGRSATCTPFLRVNSHICTHRRTEADWPTEGSGVLPSDLLDSPHDYCATYFYSRLSLEDLRLAHTSR